MMALLCHLGFHKWLFAGLDIEEDIMAKCYVCERCLLYKFTTVTTTASPDSETTLEVEKNVTDGDERSSDD